MRRALGMAGLAVLVLWGGQVGCNRPAVREKPLPDPLLTSKKPIEGKAHLAEPGARDEAIPAPPPRPEMRPGR